ncbi:diacylglycerol/lipid kinase family protein [Gemmatimonas sp.]|uniref:diacylglycerol/lipid kinase family protein n=1 Tax=Gemmatimonas sp. TaxID=1962908 RepID=UPI00391EF731
MIALIVNPAAGRGAAQARAVSAEQALRALGPLRRYDTRAAGDERRCAHAACDDGATVIAVVGGDGSVHHLVRGLLEAAGPGNPTAIPLAIYAAGTGNDLVKSLGTPAHDVQAMTERVARRAARHIDVGYIDDIPFVNAAGLGFDVEVLERMQRRSWLSGTAAYVVTALRALFGYAGYHASLITPQTRQDGAHLLTVFANGHTFGGTFRIAPDAQLDDGALDCVNIRALSPLERPGVFLRAVRGTHLDHAAVTHCTGDTFTIIAPAPLSFEADGERYGSRGAEIRVRVAARQLMVIA